MIVRAIIGLCLAHVIHGQDLTQILSPDLADGFDFPVGEADVKGWRGTNVVVDALNLESVESSTFKPHQSVHAMAAGHVIEVKSGEVWLEHRFLDNGQPQCVWIGYAGIRECSLKPGDVVKRRQRIAQVAHGENGDTAKVTLTLRHLLFADAATWLQSVSSFIRSHRQLLVPAKQERIIIAVKHAYQLHVCELGKVTLTLPIALGQNGRQRKTTDGDNRTPVGDYSITQKARGPFDGDYGAYLGAAWLRLNYPNSYDARAALQQGRITTKEHDAIVSAAKRGSLSPTGTPLGGGIGIHGWISDWPDGENHLTWGCLSLRKA
ncbi:MAG: L,D-transpeptidase, partial [Prosthecobacter sp.]